jgi:Uma2 family endonuclease
MPDFTDLHPVTKRIEFPSDMTAEEFYAYCAAYNHTGIRMERNPDGSIVIEPPVNYDSSFFETEVIGILRAWNLEQSQVEGMVTGSTAGFVLNNGAIRSPDASWISMQRLNEVAKKDLKKFLPKCPEFIVEVRSGSDSLQKMKAKMQEWIENGALLAWLLDPTQEKAWIYRADGSVEKVPDFETPLLGEEVLPGFVFDLKLLRFPF